MKKNKNSDSVTVIVNGTVNGDIIINDQFSTKHVGKKTKSLKARLKALGKLIRSIFVNITVLLLEIFAKLG